MEMEFSLQGLVRARFRSVRELAGKLGWSYSKTYRIVTGRQIPNIIEVWKMAAELKLENAAEIESVFLSPYLSTNQDKQR